MAWKKFWHLFAGFKLGSPLETILRSECSTSVLASAGKFPPYLTWNSQKCIRGKTWSKNVGDSIKLRRCNRSRLPNRLMLWLNCLLIDIFNPNLKLDFKSSGRYRLNCVQILSKSSNLIERDWLNIKTVRIRSKKSK